MNVDHSKVTSQHLSRKAVVYLRQSSPKQVHENLQSQRLQYALRDRAGTLGFREVEIIDDDLGSSAALGARVRTGFTQLLGSVALGKVGMVLSIEVARLSRTDKDWCHLLELCQVFGTLIADADHIYDLALMDDQLVLGIKGTLSVVELKVLKSRLLRGQEEKARRGELFRLVAPGYRCDGDDRIVKDPDLRVQTAIQLVFTKFRESWSARQTHKWFIDNQVSLPVNRCGKGKVTIEWQLPALPFIGSILKNPIYAGAYVYGRKPTKMVVNEGRIVKRAEGRLLPPEECRVFIRDHHEAYISWVDFEENRRRLQSNALRRGSDASVGVIRQGHGLLSGLLRCGRCGKKMRARYWGKSGTDARYLCPGDFQGMYCIGFGGATVDRRFSQWLLDVISPYGIKASLKAIESLNSEVDGKSVVFQKQLQQLEYEAQRAFEQYNAADARHRLVAAELERRWNEKLEELDQAKKTLQEILNQRKTLTAEQKQELLQLGGDFKQVWHSNDCPMEVKKKIIRTVIEEIIVRLDDSTKMLHFVIHWKGGCHTEFEMEKPRSAVGKATDVEDIELIRKMADHYDDGETARVLNRLSRRTGKGLYWSQSRVADVRRKHGIAGGRPHPERGREILSLSQAASYCRVSDTTIRKLVEAQLLPMTQVAPWAPWEIKRADLDDEPVRGIVEHLRQTGRLLLKRIVSRHQPARFSENQ
jgi:DNA invertase Pin-like site-specific DNA recombinase